MPEILFKFTIGLQDYNIPNNPRGLLFHRWLPDGGKNAVTLHTGDSKSSLKVWFERHGIVKDGWIVFELNHHKVDPKIMSLQGVLESGPVYGLLKIQNVITKQKTVLKKNIIGNAEYTKLAKRVVNILQPSVSKFLNTLRINYGQYWVREIEKWNSKEISLGNYCNNLHLKWSDNNGKTWSRFLPDKKEIRMIFKLENGVENYISQNDWKELVKVIKGGYKPSFAGITLVQAQEYMDRNELKHAFVEGVTALELATTEFLKKKLTGNTLEKRLNEFLNISLYNQVISIVMGKNEISQETLEHTLKAISIRHDIVHKGFNPTTNMKIHLIELLKTVSMIIGVKQIRFPAAGHGGRIMRSAKQWEQYYKKCTSKKTKQ